MSQAVALTILQLVALSFTADVMLLKLMSDATAHYPDRAIRRGAVAAALILFSGALAAFHVLFPSPIVINGAIVSVMLSFIVTIGALYPIVRVEKEMLEHEEEIDL